MILFPSQAYIEPSVSHSRELSKDMLLDNVADGKIKKSQILALSFIMSVSVKGNVI
jgi:hypothetical protein